MPSSVLQISCPPHHVTHFHTSQINLECIKLTWWHEGLVQFWLFGWFRADGLFSSFSQPEQTDSSPPVSPAHLCRMADPAAWSSTFNASLTCHKQHGSFSWSPPSLPLSRSRGWTDILEAALGYRTLQEWSVDPHKLILVLPTETFCSCRKETLWSWETFSPFLREQGVGAKGIILRWKPLIIFWHSASPALPSGPWYSLGKSLQTHKSCGRRQL